MVMRFLGGGIGHRNWHLFPQPDPLPSQRRAQRTFITEPQAIDHSDDSDESDSDDVESDGGYDDALEDLEGYIRDLEDDLINAMDEDEDEDEENMEDKGDLEDWGYGDPSAVQELALEQEDEEEDIGPEGLISRVDDDALETSGFGQL